MLSIQVHALYLNSFCLVDGLDELSEPEVELDTESDEDGGNGNGPDMDSDFELD